MVFVPPAPEPPAPSVSDTPLPVPPVVADPVVAPPAAPVSPNIFPAFVPAEPDDAGAVPVKAKLALAEAGKVKAPFPAGALRPVLVLSKVGPTAGFRENLA